MHDAWRVRAVVVDAVDLAEALGADASLGRAIALELALHSLKKARGSKAGDRAEKPADIDMGPGPAGIGGGGVLITHLSRSLIMLPRELRSLLLAVTRCGSSLTAFSSTRWPSPAMAV